MHLWFFSSNKNTKSSLSKTIYAKKKMSHNYLLGINQLFRSVTYQTVFYYFAHPWNFPLRPFHWFILMPSCAIVFLLKFLILTQINRRKFVAIMEGRKWSLGNTSHIHLIETSPYTTILLFFLKKTYAVTAIINISAQLLNHCLHLLDQ